MSAPGVSRAEKLFDLYGGAALGQSTQVDHQVFGDRKLFPRPAPISTTKDLGSSPSWTVDGRVGYWLEPWSRLGAAMDISYFDLKGSGAEIDIIPMPFLVMLRPPDDDERIVSQWPLAALIGNWPQHLLFPCVHQLRATVS